MNFFLSYYGKKTFDFSVFLGIHPEKKKKNDYGIVRKLKNQ